MDSLEKNIEEAKEGKVMEGKCNSKKKKRKEEEEEEEEEYLVLNIY